LAAVRLASSAASVGHWLGSAPAAWPGAIPVARSWSDSKSSRRRESALPSDSEASFSPMPELPRSFLPPDAASLEPRPTRATRGATTHPAPCVWAECLSRPCWRHPLFRAAVIMVSIGTGAADGAARRGAKRLCSDASACHRFDLGVMIGGRFRSPMRPGPSFDHHRFSRRTQEETRKRREAPKAQCWSQVLEVATPDLAIAGLPVAKSGGPAPHGSELSPGWGWRIACGVTVPAARPLARPWVGPCAWQAWGYGSGRRRGAAR
jgi:hypothetical protein